MAAKEQLNFTAWLCQYLNSLGLDGEVYGEYIASSLQSLRDCAEDERMESVMELVAGALGSDGEETVAACRAIVEEWEKCNPMTKREKQKPKKQKKLLTVEDHVDQIIKTSMQKTKSNSSTANGPGVNNPSASSKRVLPPSLSESEKKRMLQQYGYASDEDRDENDEEPRVHDPTIETNTNKSIISSVQKEMRESQKKAHEEKLERDKRSRDIQRQRKEERKEREKQRTQKHERRR